MRCACARRWGKGCKGKGKSKKHRKSIEQELSAMNLAGTASNPQEAETTVKDSQLTRSDTTLAPGHEVEVAATAENDDDDDLDPKFIGLMFGVSLCLRITL